MKHFLRMEATKTIYRLFMITKNSYKIYRSHSTTVKMWTEMQKKNLRTYRFKAKSVKCKVEELSETTNLAL